MEELLADEVLLLAGERDERDDLLGDALFLVECKATGSVAPKPVLGPRPPGICTGSSASSRYCTMIIAWFRSSTACR